VKRRKFLSLGVGLGATSAVRAFAADEQKSVPVSHRDRKPVLVKAGLSRLADGSEVPRPYQHTMVRSSDSEGRLAALVLPPAMYEHGAYQGAPLHVHHENDEWIYVLEGEYVAEVDGTRYRLRPGDSLLMPMRLPHRWSTASGTRFGVIHLYTPAGKMDVFFDDPATPPKHRPTEEDMKAEFADCGMTLLGPPLTKAEIDQVSS